MDQAQQQFIHEHTIEEITSNLTKAVVYVDTNTSLEETCKLMGKNEIVAVPIYDVNANRFVGMIDIVDIAFFVAFSYEQKHAEGNESILFKDVRAHDLLSISTEGKLMETFSPKVTLDKVTEAFSKGIHRALITTEGDRKYHILSQVDVVRFLHKSGKFDNLFSKTLNELPILFKFHPPIETMNGDAPAINGFKMLGRDRLGAVAVIDIDGNLIGNLSASDLRGVAVEYLIKTILRPAKQFLQLVRGLDDAHPVTAKMNDSLGSVVDKMVEHKLHRVWIVNDQNKLDSLVSFSDICRLFSDAYV
eukprot:Phypoly_transcript_11290.p1 GENE.Phypoly_transcript_11290~~Phypoly_transcript_11290.p1  ORF type:complete len:304 (+),score=42.82 Phypoly_transcript_11290:241-1152(+)